MSRELEIRVAGEADVPAVLAIEQATPTAPHWSEQAYSEALGEQAGAVRRCLLVAWSQGVLIGFAMTGVAGQAPDAEAELETIVVDKNARRRGVGHALLRAMTDWSRQQGAATMNLEVRAGSDGPQRLYRLAGFIVTGRRPGYYVDPAEDAVCMRLDLEAGAPGADV